MRIVLSPGRVRGRVDWVDPARYLLRGFTLVELLVATALLAALAVIVAPHLRSSPMPRLHQTSGKLADAIAFARDAAINTGIMHAFAVEMPNTDHPQHWLFEVSRVQDAQTTTVEHPVTHAPYVLLIPATSRPGKEWVSGGQLEFDTACAASVSHLLGFDSHGIPRCLDPVGIQMKAAQIDLTLDDVLVQISVSPFTGAVSQL